MRASPPTPRCAAGAPAPAGRSRSSASADSATSPSNRHAMGADVTVLSQSLKKQDNGLRLGADHYYATSDAGDLRQASGHLRPDREHRQRHDQRRRLPIAACPRGRPRQRRRGHRTALVNGPALVSQRRIVTGSLIGGLRETREMASARNRTWARRSKSSRPGKSTRHTSESWPPTCDTGSSSTTPPWPNRSQGPNPVRGRRRRSDVRGYFYLPRTRSAAIMRHRQQARTQRPGAIIPHEHLIGLRPPAASQATVLAVASFERTSISGALGSCGWGMAARANSAIAPGRKTRQ